MMNGLKSVVIVGAARTPVGSFCQSLASVPATDLGATAIKGALEKAGVALDMVDEVIMGNVISANLGQAPARQAAVKAGLPFSTVCTTVNKVCASGMKAITIAAQTISLGQSDVIVAGGMESMSNAPFYLDKARSGYNYGHQTVYDGLQKDGLWDAKYQCGMGECGDHVAKLFNLSRQDQDEFAISSYKKAANAVKSGWFTNEIVPVKFQVKGKEVVVSEDEEYKKVNFEKIPTLKPAFSKDGTVTAANASTLNDGASAVVLTSEEEAKSLNLAPIAKILSYADSERDPIEFPIAPADAVKKALTLAGKSINDIELFEINEAFSCVVLANQKILNIDPKKINIAGGGVSLGHPIGSSGCRIVVTLINLLKPGQIGCAAVCNGGGGATAIIVQKL